MDSNKLRSTAERIARNFAALGDDKAAEATADHIRKFWDPRMKAQLLADDCAALSPVVSAALERLEA